MKQTSKTIVRVRDLWDTIDECLVYFDTAKGMLWSDINAEQMEEDAKGLLKKVTL